MWKESLLALFAALVCGIAADGPCENCRCLRWTPWVNSFERNTVGDFESLRFKGYGYTTRITDDYGRPGNVAKKLWTAFSITCNHPVEIECREADSLLPFIEPTIADYTAPNGHFKCTTDQGFICLNSQQADGSCKDYEVRLLCWMPCDQLVWTQWSSHDKPSTALGDFETHQVATPSLTFEPCPRGSSPYEIQCRRRNPLIPTSALLTGQKNLVCDRNWGFSCSNTDNPPTCYDYEVRYLCRI